MKIDSSHVLQHHIIFACDIASVDRNSLILHHWTIRVFSLSFWSFFFTLIFTSSIPLIQHHTLIKTTDSAESENNDLFSSVKAADDDVLNHACAVSYRLTMKLIGIDGVKVEAGSLSFLTVKVLLLHNVASFNYKPFCCSSYNQDNLETV